MMNKHSVPAGRACALGALLLILFTPAIVPAADAWQALISPKNSLEFNFLREQKPVWSLGLIGWGPGWRWIGLNSKDKATGERLETVVPFVVNKTTGEVIQVKFQAWKSAPRQITFRYTLSADKDVPLTALAAVLGVNKSHRQGKIALRQANGEEREVKLPLGLAAYPVTASATVRLDGVGECTIAFDPPLQVTSDGDMRVILAADRFSRGTRTCTLTLTLPAEVSFLARQEDQDRFAQEMAGPDWFAFTAKGDIAPGVIGMNDWLERPAGRHGGVRMKGDRFEFEDGTPIKFWGVNLSYGGACAPKQPDAEFTAARYAKYGVNAVRLHKFTYPHWGGIGDPQDATRMLPKGLDQLDYFSAQLKARGIYYGWSHTFGFEVVAGNRDRLLAYDEIAKNLHGKTYAFINFAEDVQDLMIEMVVNLLKHKNPYTGQTYAADPALCFIELQNEDDIFFFTSGKVFDACPTYRKVFIEKFTSWLKAKYDTEEALKAAWGGALKPGESLAAKNIAPQTNPWFFGQDFLPRQKGGDRQRLLDCAQYLHEVQNRFYDRFVKAIREAGYKGPLCGSPWQAPSMLPHYYNLRSDALVGFVDRHNYFGGGLFDTMLAHPGSGYFSSGLQQVGDRPFGLSEWIHVYPSLYSAEGPAIVAAYGMGLQGWDSSYEFQSRSGPRAFQDIVGRQPFGVWETDVPNQIGQYPALARMIYRGDVKEAPVISTRRVSRDDLASGNFSFSEKVVQEGDIKSFGGNVPPAALAAGRVVVEFTEKPQASTFPDMARYRMGSVLLAHYGQLAWDTAGQGCFTVDTPGTKAVVGFVGGRTFNLGNVTFEIESPYASIFLTALDRDATLAQAKRALLCVVARNCNTGFKTFTYDRSIADNGRSPILLEPVRATVKVAGRGIKAVGVLDHDGARTDRTLALDITVGRRRSNGPQFRIDGARDRAIYYEIIFE